MKKKLLLTAFLVAALPGGVLCDESWGQLTVRIDGLENATGEVAVALFDSSQAFADGGTPVRSEFLSLQGTSCEWVVDQLPPGVYAVKAYHDLNGNRDLDRRRLGIPAEPYGFSNNARALFGPPSFEEAQFEISSEPQTIEIELRGGKNESRKR